MCAFFARIILNGSAISAQLKPNRGKPIRGRPYPSCTKEKTMNYVIAFATSAVIGLYVFIIRQCLRNPEW